MPNPKGANGHKPSPPEEEIRPWIEHYVARGFKNPEIVNRLRRHYDTDLYNVSVDLLKKKRATWKLYASRGQQHTIDSVGPAIERVRERFPGHGAGYMKNTLLREEKISVSKELIRQYMRMHHPDEVDNRRGHRLVRKLFWTAGVNDIWCMDQHDKWRRYQLFLHLGMEPFSGRLLWLKIWWTNRNPRVVCGWYCDTVESLGVIPLLTQSDLGTENNGIANAQTILRHRLDPTLSDTLQHKFRAKLRNIKPEICWRLLRQSWTPGFEALLEQGMQDGFYDPDDPLERLVFHYVFIPWLQSELDNYVEQFNDTKPRHNRHKLLPRGRPVEIFNYPKDYGSLDFSVKIDASHLEEVRDTYAPPNHPVFHLVPPAFAAHADSIYAAIGSPAISRENVWDVYNAVLEQICAIADDAEIQGAVAEHMALTPGGVSDGENEIGVLPLRRPRGAVAMQGAGPTTQRSTTSPVMQDDHDAGNSSDGTQELGFCEWTDDDLSDASD